jgi:hypothetical protein
MLKNEQHLNIDESFDHISLSKSKCWYLDNCLHFLKRAVPLFVGLFIPGKPFQNSAMKQSSLLGPFVSISQLVAILKAVFVK